MPPLFRPPRPLRARLPNGRRDRATVNVRIRDEQVAALFRNVAWSVGSAALTAVVLAALLIWLGLAPWRTGLAWCACICAFAGLHVLLAALYRARKAGGGAAWVRAAFCALCLAEGVGWGWATVFLTRGSRFDGDLLVTATALTLASASITAFGSYLPAFYAFFLPVAVPYVLVGAASGDALQRGSVAIMLLYIVGVGRLGYMSNAAFRELVGLRLQTAELAEGLRAQKEAAEQANLAKSSFLAAASHDLRQPVHALGLFVGALRRVPMAAEGERLIEQIDASVAAMDTLFGALLDISRLDAGIVEAHPEAFALQPLLERICREHAGEAQAKGIGLVLHDCRVAVRADPILLERILRNLVSNAVRHTQAGRVVVGCRRGRELSVQVWDTGPGIPADLHERIFQEYFQLQNPERDRTKGLGLGLAIVRRLAGVTGYGLSLRSEPGRGSCFSISVPRATGEAVVAAEAAPAPLGALARGLVLVVDDEAAIRDAMRALLSGWGHRVVTAASVAEALDALAQSPAPPDLIICDYRLRDGERGVEVIEGLRSEYNEPIAAMLITGDTAPDRLVEAQASGLLLLHKPVPNGKLRAAIANLMQAPGKPA